MAAGVFTSLALVTDALASHFAFFTAKPVNLALYFDGLTFLFSALTIARLKGIPARSATERAARRENRTDSRSALRTLLDGWRYLAADNRIRGVIIGTTGAFAAGGAVVGLARTYVGDLHAGQAAYGVLFGAVFLGLAAGMATGSRVLAGLPRERLFGVAITAAGLVLCVFAVVPSLLVGVLCALLVGFLGGTAWIVGQTMLGREVADELRGRTFAFVQSLIRVTLILILAVAPAVAGTVGARTIELPGPASITYGGAAITLFAAGLLAAGVGWVAYRMMDDVPGKSLRQELKAALKRTAPSSRAAGGGAGSGSASGSAGTGADADGGVHLPPGADTPGRGTRTGNTIAAGTHPASTAGPTAGPNAGASTAAPAPGQAADPNTGPYPGTFISLEGGDGSGKSTQLAALADWLRSRGHEVVVTREPGGTPLGTKLRAIVLDARNAGAISSRAEALLYAADRADHVERVIRPALARGAVVLTDRFIDSSLAYQGAGRELSQREVELLSRWATQGLMPDITVLLDLDPTVAAGRRTGPADRLELESADFHRRVRDSYLALAEADPERFVVIDAAAPITEISGRVRARLEGRVHLSRREQKEEATRQQAEAAMLAQIRAQQLALLSEEERQKVAAEAERQERERVEEAARAVVRHEHRQRLEESAARAEREAAARAREAAERDLSATGATGATGTTSVTGTTGTTSAIGTRADRFGASPEQVSAAARATAEARAQEQARERARQQAWEQAAAQHARPQSAEAADITAPSARGEWDVPDYVAEPEFDEIGEPDARSLADELFGVRPARPGRSGEDS
ncbi:dTMP kinase [Catenulispora yoronensis]